MHAAASKRAGSTTVLLRQYHSTAELAWYYAGTAFDIATHAVLLCLLTQAAAAAAPPA